MGIIMKGIDFSYFKETSQSEGIHNANMGGSSDFDIDVRLSRSGSDPAPQDFWTSKHLCTPGCGNTGTGNSFCCTCR